MIRLKYKAAQKSDYLTFLLFIEKKKKKSDYMTFYHCYNLPNKNMRQEVQYRWAL